MSDVDYFHILVVDDHADTAEMLQRLLTKDGHRVRTAAGFTPALAAATAQRFDLMLCDVGLGDGDGCDLLVKVRELYNPKAVALTGFALPDDVARIGRAGFDAHLIKPIDFAALRATVRRLMFDGGAAPVQS